MGRDGHLLVRKRLSGVDVAILEDGLAIAEDEVDGSVNVALAEELPERVSIKSVLVSLDAAAVEGRSVGVHSQGHRLVVFWAGRVAECYVPSNEALSGDS